MATDFTNNNTTISTTGGFQPKIKNTPLDMRTRVKLKADIDSIPNPFVGMKIIVLQDETNDNQMTEYVVTSLKANALGVADMKVNEVVLAKDFLGISGNGMSDEQVQQLNTAYTHSQSAHVQQSDLPTKTSELTNDSGFLTSVPSEYVTETELNAKGFLTEHQDISNKADKSEIPNKLSQLENDSDYATITQVNQAIDNAQLDGSQVDLTSYAKKTDLPTKTSQLTNDSGFITEHQDISDKADKSEIPTKTSQLQNDSGYLTSVPSEYVTETELEDKGYLTEHQDLSKYALKTEIPSVPTKTSQLTNDSGFITEHQNISGKADKSYVDTELAKKSDKTHAHSYNDLSDKPAIPSIDGLATKKELTDGLAKKSDKTHTHDQYLTEHQDISGKANKSDIPIKTSQLINDSSFISSIPSEYVTEEELETKGYLTEHQDISNKADKSEIPTKTSQLTNDSGFISTIPSEYVTETELNTELSTKANKSDIPSLDGYATESFVTNKIAEASLSGGEVDLSGYATKDELSTKANKSEVPTKTSQLTNNSGFLTSIPSEYITESKLNAKGYLTSVPSEYITETELNSKGYLTQHQDLSNYALKTEIPSVPTKTSQLTNDSDFATNASVDEIKASLSTVKETLLKPELWEIGGIAYGVTNTGMTSRLRLKEKYQAKKGDVICFKLDSSVFKFGINLYDETGEWNGTDYGWNTSDFTMPIDGYFRLVLAYKSGENFTDVASVVTNGFSVKTQVNTQTAILQDAIETNMAINSILVEYGRTNGASYVFVRIPKYLNNGEQIKPIVALTSTDDSIDGTKCSVLQYAKDNNCIFTVNGGLFNMTSSQPVGQLIIDGISLINTPMTDDNGKAIHDEECYPLAIDSDGNLTTYPRNADTEQMIQDGIKYAVTAWGKLVDNFQICTTDINNEIVHPGKNIRQSIGQYQNGDYCVCTADMTRGNVENEAGLSYEELAQIFVNKGVKFAYSLDGGGSAQTVLGKRPLNPIYEGSTGRKVPTVIQFIVGQ